MASLRPCLEPGCPRLTVGSRCPDHESERRRAEDSRRLEREPWRAVYSTPEWRAARRKALARACYRCEFVTAAGRCARTHGRGEALQVHHVLPLANGGAPYELGNLRVLCSEHHAYVERMHRESTDVSLHLPASVEEALRG